MQRGVDRARPGPPAWSFATGGWRWWLRWSPATASATWPGLEHASADSLFRRFMAPIVRLSESQLRYLLDVDHRDHEARPGRRRGGRRGRRGGALRAAGGPAGGGRGRRDRGRLLAGRWAGQGDGAGPRRPRERARHRAVRGDAAARQPGDPRAARVARPAANRRPRGSDRDRRRRPARGRDRRPHGRRPARRRGGRRRGVARRRPRCRCRTDHESQPTPLHGVRRHEWGWLRS